VHEIRCTCGKLLMKATAPPSAIVRPGHRIEVRCRCRLDSTLIGREAREAHKQRNANQLSAAPAAERQTAGSGAHDELSTA